MRTRTFYESLGRLTINITPSDAKQGSHRGQCDEDIKTLIKKPYIKKQLDKLNPAVLADVLKEYGAWDEDELKDHAENIQRILWIACCNIVEESK